MSDRPQESTTPASSTANGGTDNSNITSAPASLPPSTHSRELPPPPRPSRSASFSNILNPDDDSQRRRKVPELDSPSSASTAPIPNYKYGQQSPSMSGPPSAHLEHRRILTPKSPGLHRAASMGQLNNPTGSIDAQRSPFLHTRTYTAEPGAAGVPPMPTQRGQPAGSPSTTDRRTSSSTQDMKARSPSVSPRTAYAPHYSSVRGSPSSATLPSLSAMPFNADMDRQRPMSIPISSATGQNVYQMMTLQTSAGAVQVPVDVQAASRVADEKRRRNAGASARFRARRKEKEKESSSTISKLEMQVKELTEDVEFYRRERGYLAGIVLQVPGGDRHFPRPQSPRHRRVSIQRSTSGSGEYISGHEMSRSPGDGRNVRRRTSTLSSMPVPAAAGPSYAAAAVPPPPPHPSQQHYDQQYHPQQPLPGPASLLPPIHGHPSSSGAWNPYNSEQRERHTEPHAR